MRKIIVAIDGVSACGKSVTARKAAHILGYLYCDSGAMYRAIAAHFLAHHIDTTNAEEIARAVGDMHIAFGINTAKQATEIYVNGSNMEGEIRTTAVSKLVSHVSALKQVRQVLVKIQQQLGKDKGIVMDGRDIGTTVFPQAALKLFMTASLAARGLRRKNELWSTNNPVDLGEVMANLKKRDRYDSTRTVSPLRKAADAIVLDTTHMSIDEQVDEVVRLAIAKIASSS